MKKLFSLVALVASGSLCMAVAQEVSQDTVPVTTPVVQEAAQDTIQENKEEVAPVLAGDSVAAVGQEAVATELDSALVNKTEAVEAAGEGTSIADNYQNIDWGAKDSREENIAFGKTIAGTWEYRLTGRFNTTTGTSTYTSDESVGFDFTLDYNLTRNISAGFSTGYIHDFGGTSNNRAGRVMPLLGDAQFRIYLRRRVSIFMEGRAGMLLQLEKDVKYRDPQNPLYGQVSYKYPHYMYYEFQPGISYRFGRKLEIRVSAGYGYASPFHEDGDNAEKTYDETVVTFQGGFIYHFIR